MNLLELRKIDDRPDIDAFVQAIAQAQGFDTRHKHIDQFVANGLVRDHAAASGAALSGGAIGAPQDTLDRQAKVGIVHHDYGVFAAHLQRDPFERLRGLDRYMTAHFGRARK